MLAKTCPCPTHICAYEVILLSKITFDIAAFALKSWHASITRSVKIIFKVGF